jgi:hypothetical protein
MRNGRASGRIVDSIEEFDKGGWISHDGDQERLDDLFEIELLLSLTRGKQPLEAAVWTGFQDAKIKCGE